MVVLAMVIKQHRMFRYSHNQIPGNRNSTIHIIDNRHLIVLVQASMHLDLTVWTSLGSQYRKTELILDTVKYRYRLRYLEYRKIPKLANYWQSVQYLSPCCAQVYHHKYMVKLIIETMQHVKQLFFWCKNLSNDKWSFYMYFRPTIIQLVPCV